MADFRDIAIEQAVAEQDELLDRLVDMTIDRNAYRTLAQQALHYAASVVKDRDQIRRRYHEMLAAHRAERRMAA